MKDIAGRSLSIGDLVAVTYLGSPSLKLGRVSRFTPKKTAVEFFRKRANGEAYSYEETKFSDQICIVEKSEV